MELDLGVCRVRSWRWGDRESLARHADDRKVWINLRDRFPHPYTLADADRWLQLVSQMTPESQFAICVDGAAVGGIGIDLLADVQRLSGEIGYWLGVKFWGRGIATAALRAVTQHAFSTYNLCRIQAAVFEWNPASMRVLEKAGYLFEGRLRRSVTKDGKTIDQCLYAVLRDEWEIATRGQAPSSRREEAPQAPRPAREEGRRARERPTLHHGILETCLCAPDLDAAEGFYTTVVGLDVISRVPARHVFFRCGQGVFLVFDAKQTGRVVTTVAGIAIPLHGTQGAGHVAFAVKEADLGDWRTRLGQLGVPIEAEITWPEGGHSIYVRDPAGNSVEFATPRIWGLPESGGSS